MAVYTGFNAFTNYVCSRIMRQQNTMVEENTHFSSILPLHYGEGTCLK